MSKNLYGTAMSVFSVAIVGAAGGIDVACGNNVTTTIVTNGPMVPASAGIWYARVDMTLNISFTATPPTAMLVALNLNGGANADSYGFNAAALVANADLTVGLTLFSIASEFAFQPPGATVNITLNPTTNGVFVRNLGTRAAFQLVRGPDQ